MKKTIFLSIWLVFCTTLFSQPVTKPAYDSLIKISPADSLVEIHPGTKNKLNQLLVSRTDQLAGDHSLSRFLFTGTDKKSMDQNCRWLAARLQKDLYKVDLSALISKYIGETEKNLEKVFRNAENKNWILYFDEADELFGKRTNVKDSHDRYANQGITYLLQRIEKYEGLPLVASNSKENIKIWKSKKFTEIDVLEKRLR